MIRALTLTAAASTCGLAIGCVVVVAALYLGYGGIDTTASW